MIPSHATLPLRDIELMLNGTLAWVEIERQSRLNWIGALCWRGEF